LAAATEDSFFNREDGTDGQTVLADRDLYNIKNIRKKGITNRESYPVRQAPSHSQYSSIYFIIFVLYSHTFVFYLIYKFNEWNKIEEFLMIE
jgi:hypothetical protein